MTRRRLAVAAGGLLVAVAAGVLLGRGFAARWAHQSAAGHLAAGAIGPAERSLAWAEWIDAGNPQTALLRAAALRRLGEIDAWRSAVAAAETAGAPADSIHVEKSLGALRWGNAPSVAPGDYEDLTADGATPRDAIHAIVHCLLAKGQRDEAQRTIEAWVAAGGEPAEAAFLRGISWWSAGERELAQAEFEKTLASKPSDEMARADLVLLLEERHEYAEALQVAAPLLVSSPDRESVRVEVAALLRKLGRLDEARRLVPAPADGSQPSVRVALELASIEYESGNYEQARRWFEQADLEGEHISETLRTAASNYAYLGQSLRSGELFFRTEEAQARQRQTTELERRLGLNPGDAVAAQQLWRLSQRPAAVRPPGGGDSLEGSASLYARHCSVCHGQSGEGDGRAAQHLFPRPRNLRKDKYRLVSTLDRVPTEADIERVIREGIPGTSMPAFAKLTADERTTLAREVLAMFETRFGDRAAAEDDNVLPIPEMAAATSQSIELGRVTFFKSGCQQCHPTDDAVDEAANEPPVLYDDELRPTTPRDLACDPLKGGADGPSLYRRIRLGMPGTPHPASPSLSEEETIALVHYCQSLGTEPKRQLTNHERELKAARQSRPRD